MKQVITLLALITGLIFAGCGSNDETHPHGEDGDHTHEQSVQQSTGGDSDAVRIGSGEHSDEESDHSHDEDSDHSHEEEHSHDEPPHTHADEDSTHQHDGEPAHSHDQ